MKNLEQARVGNFEKVQGVAPLAPIKIKRRLLELGFTKGQSVKVVRKSLIGKTFLVELRGYTLTLRQDVAKLILI